MAYHVWNNNHDVDFTLKLSKLLKEVKNEAELDIWENIYIYKNKHNFNFDESGTTNMLFKLLDKVGNAGSYSGKTKNQLITSVAADDGIRNKCRNAYRKF